VSAHRLQPLAKSEAQMRGLELVHVVAAAAALSEATKVGQVCAAIRLAADDAGIAAAVLATTAVATSPAVSLAVERAAGQ